MATSQSRAVLSKPRVKIVLPSELTVTPMKANPLISPPGMIIRFLVAASSPDAVLAESSNSWQRGALLDGSLGSTGVVEPATWLSPDAYIELLRSNGVGLMTRVTPESDQRVFQRRLWGTSTREGGRR